jgi:hypothetical protein
MEKKIGNKKIGDKRDACTTIISVAFVLRMPLELVPQLKVFLTELQETRIVYQRVSPAHLMISEDPKGCFE